MWWHSESHEGENHRIFSPCFFFYIFAVVVALPEFIARPEIRSCRGSLFIFLSYSYSYPCRIVLAHA